MAKKVKMTVKVTKPKDGMMGKAKALMKKSKALMTGKKK